MQDSEAKVRKSFADQAAWCERLGSPFTALLCETIGENLDRSTAIGKRILDWTGQPDATGDAVVLRLTGGLHALVRRGSLPRLAVLYPPHPMPSSELLWDAVNDVLNFAAHEIMPWLDGAPQTNEVARSAILFSGLLAIATRAKMPLALYELGASAGLNLVCDRYAYRFAGNTYGAPDSPLVFSPTWRGPLPPDSELTIARRRGVDLNPIDATSASHRERLIAYIWPDQADRLERCRKAIETAAQNPPSIDRADAAEWVMENIDARPEPGICRVLMHSISYQYFPQPTRARIAERMSAAGAQASEAAPVAWLWFEVDPEFAMKPTLRLTYWPDGSEKVLAEADAHVRSIKWFG